MAGFKNEKRGGQAFRADRDRDWPLFVQGGPGDRAKPNAWQVMVLNDLSGPEGRCAGASDDEVLGVLGQWGAAGSWLEGRKLAVVRELIRRRPDERNSGIATESGLPWDWDHRLAREVSLQLGLSVPAAGKLIWVAWALEARLPGIGQALDEGRLDAGQVRMIVQETDVLLDPELLAAAELIILAGLAKCRTWADLLRLVQRAVVTVDPEGARKRREQEEKENGRVHFWREAAGTCALMGAGLPADEALRAHARVDQRAQAYRRAGVKRPIEILRVAAYLDLLNGVPAADRVARFRTENAAGIENAAGGRDEDAGQAGSDARLRAAARKAAAARAGRIRPGTGDGYPDDAGQDQPRDSGPAGRVPADSAPGDDGAYWDDFPWDYLPDGPASPCAACGYNDCQCGGTGDPGPGDSGAGNRDGGGTRGPSPRPADGGEGGGSGTDPGAACASEVNLTLRHLDIPFLTALGHAQRPGEARSLGVLDPALARRLAEAAARHPDSKFCLTIVDGEGHAIGHGCCKPGKLSRPGRRRPRRKAGTGPRDGPAPASPQVASAFTFTPRDDPGPPGGLGSWLLTLPGRTGEYIVDLHPVPTGECGHHHESGRHDPGDLLRHLVTIRDGKCGFPTCGRHASESDFEHARPYEKGGRTCGCNCYACSRSCHRLKQSDGWEVTEIRPGYHQWTTPSGRTYLQEPWQYPA